MKNNGTYNAPFTLSEWELLFSIGVKFRKLVFGYAWISKERNLICSKRQWKLYRRKVYKLRIEYKAILARVPEGYDIEEEFFG